MLVMQKGPVLECLSNNLTKLEKQNDKNKELGVLRFL